MKPCDRIDRIYPGKWFKEVVVVGMEGIQGRYKNGETILGSMVSVQETKSEVLMKEEGKDEMGLYQKRS